MKLTAIITPDELADSSPMFIALCPELDVVSQGETTELAVAKLKEAVEGVLEIADAAEIRQRLQNGAIVQTLGRVPSMPANC